MAWLYDGTRTAVIFMVVTVVLLIGVARYSGFEKSLTWLECVVDAFVGFSFELTCKIMI